MPALLPRFVTLFACLVFTANSSLVGFELEAKS